MSPDTFRSSLLDPAPPADTDAALQGLWWAGKGKWDRAHDCVQAAEGTARADWVHAYLHRVEGDEANAGYWYRRAGHTPSTTPLPAEWDAIATTLLAG